MKMLKNEIENAKISINKLYKKSAKSKEKSVSHVPILPKDSIMETIVVGFS